MDSYKNKMMGRCGPGGIKCRCCNPFHAGSKLKDKAKLNRFARRALKNDDKKVLTTDSD
jgi:hypothetical protein